jgi:hypothetical protein
LYEDASPGSQTPAGIILVFDCRIITVAIACMVLMRRSMMAICRSLFFVKSTGGLLRRLVGLGLCRLLFAACSMVWPKSLVVFACR